MPELILETWSSSQPAMDTVNNSLSYCCVWKDGRLLYTYSGGRNEIDELAALCLEMIPPFHRWYFHSVGNKTFGYLMEEDGHVYFAIVDHGIGSAQVLRFLEKLKDEFGRVGKEGCSRLNLQEQFRHLVASLEGVEWPADNNHISSTNANANGRASTKAPLLGKGKGKGKGKGNENGKTRKATKDRDHDHDHVVEMEDHSRSSTDRGMLDSNNFQAAVSPSCKDFSSSRNLQNRWCRQVRLILAIDAAICVVLFIIWLVICNGIECIR